MIHRRAAGDGDIVSGSRRLGKKFVSALLLPSSFDGHVRPLAVVVYLILVTTVVLAARHRGGPVVHRDRTATIIKMTRFSTETVIPGRPYAPQLKNWRQSIFNRSSLVLLPRHHNNNNIAQPSSSVANTAASSTAACLEWRMTRCDNDVKDIPSRARRCSQKAVEVVGGTSGYCYCRDGSRSSIRRDLCGAGSDITEVVNCEDECQHAMSR